MEFSMTKANQLHVIKEHTHEKQLAKAHEDNNDLKKYQT